MAPKLILLVAFLGLTYLAPGSTLLQPVIRWPIVAARAAIWYGFLAALIAAQRFA
jgi:hypothetical protein